MSDENYERLKSELRIFLKDIDINDIGRKREKISSLFNETFGKDTIDNMTKEKAEKFFIELNRNFKNNVRYKKALEDFPQFKNGIKYLLHGELPLGSRIDDTLHFDQSGIYPYKIMGMQRSPTILLNLNDPEKCCIWNHNTQKILFEYGLIEPIDTSWMMYKANNDIQKKLASDLGLDLFTLDYVMRHYSRSLRE